MWRSWPGSRSRRSRLPPRPKPPGRPALPTRRTFLTTLAAGALAPGFRPDAFRRLARAEASAARAVPSAVATDEAYWIEIRRAFDLDGTLVNLNNGGVSPTPSHVLEAMIRDLRFSNEL